MFFQFLADYLKHRLRAKTRHGTHSPFVYKLVDEVIYDFSDKKVYKDIEQLRKKLLRDDVKFVRNLAKRTLSPRLGQLLYRLAKQHPAKKIIELGTYSGLTTSYLAKANEQLSVLTIADCSETVAVALENFALLGLTHIDLRVGNFNELFLEELRMSPGLDFLFLSGNPTKEAILSYFNGCLPQVHEGSLVIIDDIYRSEGMKQAWKEIKAHPQVTVTIDLFWIGLVYFKKDQVKEHFKIRF